MQGPSQKPSPQGQKCQKNKVKSSDTDQLSWWRMQDIMLNGIGNPVGGELHFSHSGEVIIEEERDVAEKHDVIDG